MNDQDYGYGCDYAYNKTMATIMDINITMINLCMAIMMTMTMTMSKL